MPRKFVVWVGDTMKCTIRFLFFIAIGIVINASGAIAQDLNLDFMAHRLSAPPMIENISFTKLPSGDIQISAKISAQTQMKSECEKSPEACGGGDWRLIPDPAVEPNPPLITKVILYYYAIGDESPYYPNDIEMTYDENTGLYAGNIPVSNYDPGKRVVYYLTAMDTMGNIATQKNNHEDYGGSNHSLNCDYATGYQRCDGYVTGEVDICGRNCVANDLLIDVCGEPESSGQPNITGTRANKVDIIGTSAGVDSIYLHMNMAVQGPISTMIDGGPMESYMFLILNPDVVDPNPADNHLYGAYIFTYIPEAYDYEDYAFNILWDAECISNPDVRDPMACKLKSTRNRSTDMEVSATENYIGFISKISGTGDVNNVPFELVGPSSKSVILTAMTGEMILSGESTFWTSDLSPALRYYTYNQIVEVPTAYELIGNDPPLISDVSCSPAGRKNTCAMSGEINDKIAYLFNVTVPDEFRSVEQGIRVYGNSANSFVGSELIIDSGCFEQECLISGKMTGSGDGKYYFFITYYDAFAFPVGESMPAAANCDVAISQYPDTPAMINPIPYTSISCTPSWGAALSADECNHGLYRCNGTAAACTKPESFTAIAQGIKLAYGLSYADFDVTVNTPYYYCATAEDASGNESPVVGASDNKNCGPCVPHDDPPPACENCVVISSCADYGTGANCIPVTTVNTAARGEDGKFASAGLHGATVLLLDGNNNTVATTVTDANGNYKLEIPENGAVNFNDTFKVAIQIPAAQKQGVPCNPGFAGDACYILLESNIKLSADAVDNKIAGLPLPAPGGGRAEAGNPNCDNTIDVRDLLVFKDAFGANSGDANYKTYADFDGNGKIDVEDFLIFKKNFGKTLDAAPVFDATLCKPW